MSQPEPFRLPAHELADGHLPEWGVRRADGQPWRSERRHEGDISHYTLGDELSADGVILHAVGATDAISMMVSQHEGDDLPQPGEVIVVHRVFRSYRDDPQHPGWRRWWVDADPDALIRHLSTTIQACTRLMSPLAILLNDRKADQ